jgi:dTMP kinase
MGYFITFEGIEGSGKTTQIRKAADFLAAEKIPCLLTEEPGGTGLGHILRKILLDKTALRIGDRAELLLFAADRAQHVEETILPALREGKVVLCDRFFDATTAYQGFGRGLERDAVRWLNDFAAGSLRPDRTFLFDIPPEQGLERVRTRSVQNGSSPPERDRFEAEEGVFHRRIREGYLALAKEEPDRFRVFRGSDSIDSLHREVVRNLLEILRR